jgi:hypothetical protein
MLERLAGGNRGQRKRPAHSRGRALNLGGIELGRQGRQLLEQGLHFRVLSGLQVCVREIVGRVQRFADVVRFARRVCGRQVGRDRIVPRAHARKDVRRHVQRVRGLRRDVRVAASGRDRAVGQGRRVVAVNDVVRDPGMIRLLRVELLRIAAALS